jgi:hypothetical protein
LIDDYKKDMEVEKQFPSNGVLKRNGIAPSEDAPRKKTK